MASWRVVLLVVAGLAPVVAVGGGEAHVGIAGRIMRRRAARWWSGARPPPPLPLPTPPLP